MENQFTRSEILLGSDSMEILKNSRVAVFGVGGVGGYVVEALARSGVGHIDIIDNDTVSITNINRQIIATLSSVGKYKVDVMKERIMDINPNAEINAFRCFYMPETKDQFDLYNIDINYELNEEVTKEYCLNDDNTLKRYNLLNQKIKKFG